MADNKINWPDNVNVQGLMSFPLYSVENLDQVKEWRDRKNFAKPKFPDRIGFSLFLNQAQHDRVKANLLDVYLPFAATLQAESNKSKGVDPKIVAKLVKLVQDDDFSENNLPIRDLNDKDEENLDKNEVEGIVSKLRVAGPPQDGPIKRKAIVTRGGVRAVVPLDDDDVYEKLGEQSDPTTLWWGAMWPFRTAVRFNAYQAANFGVAAYVNTAYLLADRELMTFGGGDAAVVEDGDDWED